MFRFTTPKFDPNKKVILTVLGVVLLVAGIAAGVYLTLRQQNLSSRAAAPVVSVPEESLTLLANKSTLNTGEEIMVRIFARSDLESANLFNAKIKFPADMLEVTGLILTPMGINQGTSFEVDPGEMLEQIIMQEEGATNVLGDATSNPIPTLPPYPTLLPTESPLPFVSATPLPTQNATNSPAPQPTEEPAVETPMPGIESTAPPEELNVTLAYFVQSWLEQSYDNQAGTISLVGGVPTPGYRTQAGKKSALMATIKLRAKKAGIATLSLEDTSAILGNTANINILTTKRDAVLTISGEDQLAASGSATVNNSKPTPTPKALVACDVNGDGKLNLSDLSVLLSNYNKKDVPKEVDCIQDGVINTVDLSGAYKELQEKGVIKRPKK